MKIVHSRNMLVALCVAAAYPVSLAHAQAPSGYPSATAPTTPVLTAADLQNLVGQVALYPDDLLALILPASTTPLDVIKAQRFLTKFATDKSLKPDPSISEPVMNLLTYPDVIQLMGDQLDWTESLGQAVTVQQLDVLEAIQIFRRKAQAAGNLKSDDKQIIIVQQETVQIVPAKPEVIYVPQYQPATVIVAQPAPVVTYIPTPYPVYYNPAATVAAAATVGYIAGATTAYGLNWYGGAVYHAPCAAHAAYYQDQRMDYANNAREDWQDYGTASREDWQNHANQAQGQRQNATASNQAARQETSSANQGQRQDALQNTTANNQTQRQDAAAGGQQQRTDNQTQRQATATGAQASSQQSQAARQSSVQQNQAARQSSAPQGAQRWQGSAATTTGGQYANSGQAAAAAANRTPASTILGTTAGSGQRPSADASSSFGTRQATRPTSGAYGGASSGARAQSYSERGSRSMSGGGGGAGGARGRR